jgi:hypothetical protein
MTCEKKQLYGIQLIDGIFKIVARIPAVSTQVVELSCLPPASHFADGFEKQN